MTSLKLFLFDLDGTLVSTGGAGMRALSKAFKELFGIENAHQLINPGGKTDPAIFREIMRVALQREPTDDEIQTIAETYLSYLETEMRTSTPRVLDGVGAFVEKISTRADIVMGLGTGNLEKGARLKLAPVKLNEFFSFGGFGSDHEERSEVLRFGHRRAEALTKKKIPTDAVYIIGDTLLDIAAAKRAGFKSVAVASGRVSREELNSGAPDFLLSTLLEGDNFL
jgi:phosphoglycolate phosphatase-like HAD superfamily hydrolase